MLSAAKHLPFPVENNKKQIPRADYRTVFKWRSAPRFARDDRVGGFFSSLFGPWLLGTNACEIGI
jgi:hypothetical protein